MPSCSLCQLDATRTLVQDGERAFCCAGCQAVYNILSIRNELDGFRDTIIFRQALKFGLISNPLLLSELQQTQPSIPEEEWQKWHCEIKEMWCPSCAEVIRYILLKQQGIRQCLVDYATDIAVIEFSPRSISKKQVQEVIAQLGYHPCPLEDRQKNAVSRILYLRFIIAAFCALNAMMFAYPIYAAFLDFDTQDMGLLFAWLSFFVSIPVCTYCAWPIFKHAWNGCKIGFFGMESLVAIGVFSACVISFRELYLGGTQVYFDSMTVIVAFVLLGKIIEAKAKFSAKDALIQLTSALPRRGRKRLPDGDHFAAIKDIKLGDILVVKMGEKIILDGVVAEGEGYCDESVMTGEPVPVFKAVGAKVLAGTLLQSGWLAYKTTSEAKDSALQRIVEMIEQDLSHKAPYVRMVDKLTPIFVPLVLLIAILASIRSWTDGIAVLLISCPCAIGIAVPLVEAHLLNRLTKLGAIVRNRGCLSYLGKETVFIFDKTGTVTEGHIQVVKGLESLSEKELGILKGMSSLSNHPISQAIQRAISSLPAAFDSFQEIAGQGIEVKTECDSYSLGSFDFMRSRQISISEENALNPVVYFAKNTQSLAHIHCADKLRHEVKDVVGLLHPIKTVLLSGDAHSVVSHIASQAGFSAFKAKCRPLDKREYVQALKQNGEMVCMVGDGINDAPALTAAQIGISVLSAADISIQVSDILLTTSHLKNIPEIRALAKKGRRLIHQNLFWAFFYNAAGIGLAAAGKMTPLFAAAAMVCSSLIVVLNAGRINLPGKDNLSRLP
jgi:heavy metal translocating P-type ATPase